MELHPAHSDLGLNLYKSPSVSIRVTVIGGKNTENYRFLYLALRALCFIFFIIFYMHLVPFLLYCKQPAIILVLSFSVPHSALCMVGAQYNHDAIIKIITLTMTHCCRLIFRPHSSFANCSNNVP